MSIYLGEIAICLVSSLDFRAIELVRSLYSLVKTLYSLFAVHIDSLQSIWICLQSIWLGCSPYGEKVDGGEHRATKLVRSPYGF